MVVYSIYIVKNSISKKSLAKSGAFLKNFTLLSCLFIVLTMAGCSKGKNKKKIPSADEVVYSSKNYSDLVLDSSIVSTFLSSSAISDSIKSEVNQFYLRRNYQFGWFNEQGMTCAAPNLHAQLQNYKNDFADSTFHDARLDFLMTAAVANEKQFLSQKKLAQELDLLLTTTFFKYSQKVYGGITENSLSLDWYIPRKKKNYQILLDSLVSSVFCEKIQEPVNQYYILLKAKLRQYRVIQKKGGLPAVITDTKLLAVGDSNTCLVNAKQHLFLTGDLKANDNTIYFTDSLAKAVQRFQHRMGLVENGKINLATIVEFNKPIDFRIKQMMVNMERLRWIPVEMENEYLLVNIPEFRLHIFENKKQVWQMNVVVGKAATKTSVFKGNLSQVVLNPYWNVPTSIVKNEILPKISRNSNYLARNNMEVVDGVYRQKPGKNNSLGKIKFLFPNSFSIYLHDTPSKGLFGESKRAFSHGCIRVSEPRELAFYLLRKNANWNEEKVDDILKTDNMTNIIVRPTVPVYIAYFTAWVDNTGQLNFRNDIYNLDQKLSKEIFGE
jgi:L,D-transpeptidase YcbB